MDLFGEPDTIESADETEDFDPAISPAFEASQDLFTHPRHMPFCLGQDNAEQTLIALHNIAHMPHGIIFSGPKGIGKATMAFRLTKFLLKNGGGDTNQNPLFNDAPSTPTSLDIPPDDRISRLVSSGGHPDLLTVERHYDPQKNKTPEALAVAELRKVEPFLRRTASEGGWRIVIIDDADTMNRNAQNALLKILEEPPKQTLIILIAHRAGALIPTIRSRARTLNFDPLTPEIIRNLLAQKGETISSAQSEILSAMAEGSFGKTCALLEQGGLDILDEILSILETLPRPDWTKIHAFADRLAKQGGTDDYATFTETILWLYKALSFAKARGQALNTEALNKPPLTGILQNSSLAQLLKICENLSEAFDTTAKANLDKRQAVMNAFQIITA